MWPALMSLQPEQLSSVGQAVGRATAILLITAGATLLLRRHSASRRHLVIMIGVVGSFIAPVIVASGLQLNVAILNPSSVAAVARRDAPGSARLAPPAPGAIEESSPIVIDRSRIPEPAPVAAPDLGVSPASPVSALPAVSPTFVVLALWLLGAFAVLGQVLRGVIRRSRLETTANPVLPAPWERSRHRLEACGRIPARVRILATERSRMPMTWGTLSPVVLVPAWIDWSDEERDAALLHELAHVHRSDALALTLTSLMRAVHWYNPVVWWLSGAERLAREEACDDLVLEAGVKPSTYAEQLLGIVRGPDDEYIRAAALAMARPSSLATRLCAILRADQPREIPGLAGRAAIMGASLALTACISTVRPVERAALPQPVAPRVASVGVIDPEPASVAAPAAAVAAVVATDLVLPSVAAPPETPVPSSPVTAAVMPLPDAIATPATVSIPSVGEAPETVAVPWPQQDRCQGKRGSNHSSIHSDDGDRITRISWSRNGCELELSSRGDFTLSSTLDDLRSVSRGGYFSLREDDGKDERQVRITPRGDGTLDHDYRVNGDKTAWGPEGQAWFARTVLILDRRTAFAVDVRLPQLMQRGGVEAVLTEIDQLEGDYARRIYFVKLTSMAQLSSAQLVRVIESAAAKIESDYEMAELLIAASKQRAFEDPAQLALARAAGKIESDYEKRRVFSTLLKKDGLSPATVGAILAGTNDIDSDYELAELLIEVSKRYAVEPSTRKYYLDALGTIDSDYEYRRVLTALTQSGPLPSEYAATILEHAGRHMSGYELAELLVAMDKAVAGDRSLGPVFMGAVRRVGSDYEKGRVLKDLVRAGPDTAVVVLALGEAQHIGSSYERTELLLAVAQKFRVEGRVRDAYLDAAGSIDSEYDRNRALAAIAARAAR